MDVFADLRGPDGLQVWDGIVGRVVEGDNVTFSVIELDPGAVASMHSHPQEQLGVVVEGAMRFTIGGETRDLGPGEAWRIPGGTPHEAVAGPDGALLVEVFSPRREDWGGLARVERPGRLG